ncbi:hypothetical protein G5C60_19070 [Streptomyces sp. HC44]|uniref:Gliding motility protein n=1 Tax=Streptomyces scabichelini TaxID=2711217 RepID=A0A6G4V728_9ACTN|nr:hypothetical protein [Streptomyces scabichelini]NGO09643.1 hypothetical protein [Streptomyces scabichelini]
MGVFARLLRKDKPQSKGSEEASTSEAQAGTLTAEPDSEAKLEDAAQASADAEAAETSADSTGTASDGAEIPKQQSAGEAADNEADEGARK